MSDRLPSVFVRYFRQFWGYAGARIIVIIVLSIVMSYAEGIGLAMFLPLFDQKGGDTSPISKLLGMLHIEQTAAVVLPMIIGLYLLKGVLQYATMRYQLLLSRDVSRRLRRRALDALAHADYQHVAGTNAGFYSNFLTNEVNRAASGFLYFVRSLSPALSASVLFIMVFLLDWRLSLACVAMGVILIGVTRITGFVVRRHSLVVTKQNGVLAGLLIQVVHAYKYLRATGSYHRFDKRVWASSEAILDADLRATSANAFLLAMTQPLMVVFLGSLLYFRAVVQGAPLAPLFVLLLYFFRVMNEVFQLQNNWQTFCGLIGSVDLVNEQTEATERAAEPLGEVPYAPLHEAIVLDHVGFSYKTGRQVLDDINLRIPARTTVAFVGGSGAGKSTLVDLLTGTLRASQGAVMLDGTNLAKLDLRTLREHVGYVPQDAMLFDDTVAANIALWSSSYTEDQIRDAATRARCLEFIERMPHGFDTPVGDRGVKLSGGQRQRLAIARELIRRPDILILDEATSALDSESELAIQQSIEQLKGQMTIVIIAHRLSTIRGADRVYVLSEGKVVEEGGFDELAGRPGGVFNRMCELQELAP